MSLYDVRGRNVLLVGNRTPLRSHPDEIAPSTNLSLGEDGYAEEVARLEI